MTAWKLVYLDTVFIDFEDIARHLTSQIGNDAMEAYVLKIQERCAKLSGLPGTMGQARSNLRPGLRSTPHGNYTIFFRYTEDRLEIVDVLHSARDLETLFEVASE